MKSYSPTATLISLTLLVSGCQPVAEQPDSAAEGATHAEDVAAIKSLFDARIAANNVGDGPAFVALLTDDAIVMRGVDPELIGKDAILSNFQAHHGQFVEEVTGELVEVEVFGDWAFDRGTVTIKLTPRVGGAPTGLTARFIDLLRRQPDGSWKIHCLMANEFLDRQGGSRRFD